MYGRAFFLSFFTKLRLVVWWLRHLSAPPTAANANVFATCAFVANTQMVSFANCLLFRIIQIQNDVHFNVFRHFLFALKMHFLDEFNN